MPALYLDFILARDQAREAKELGFNPASDDPILRKYSFCNINREHDRVTRWIKAHVRDNKALKTKTQMVQGIAMARVFNDPEVLEEVLGDFDPPGVLKRVLARQARGKRIFRGAYMMPSHGSSDQLKMSPAVYYMRAIEQLGEFSFKGITTLEGTCSLILTVHGFGPFVANQIITDLRYTKWYKDAPDWETYVLGGPGTSRGLCRYFGEPLRIDKRQDWIHPHLMEVRGHVVEMLGEPFRTYFRDPNNVSNSFCEFDKYARVLLGEGRINRMYIQK